MRYLLLLVPVGFFLTSCGTGNTAYRDFDGSYSWSNSQAYREGYESGYQQGYQEGSDDQAAQDDQDGRSVRAPRTRTIIRYEYYPTYYYHWSQPWILHDPYAYYGGWDVPNRWNGWNRPNRWNTYYYGWNDPWYGGYGWNPYYGYGGYSGWNDPWYGGYGWNPYYGYGAGYYGWNRPYYRRYDRWNRPGGGWNQPGGGNGSGSGTVDPTPDNGIRRQRINDSSTPYRRPVVTNNPGGGSVDQGRPGMLPAERGVDATPSRPSGSSRPGTLNDDTPTRGSAPVRPAAAPREPQGGSRPAVRQPEVRKPESRQPEVRQPQVRQPESRQPEGRRTEPAARQPEFRQPSAPRSTPSAPAPRSNPAPSNGGRRP